MAATHKRRSRVNRLHLFTVVLFMSVALEVVSVAGKAAGKKSKSSRKEERAAVDEKLKKFVCPGHEEVKKPKQKTLFKAAQTLMGSKNFGDALACAIHAGRLDPLGAYKEWNFAARLRERIPSAISPLHHSRLIPFIPFISPPSS